jgi:UDP-3-O-[3-hydroxymyristoyl] glucosamine N-acyltransferase
VGARSVFAGQAGAAGHLEIGERAVVAAKTAVFADVPAGSFVAGIPAVDHRQWKRAQAALKKLPELRAELRELRARLEAIEKHAKGEA